MFLPGYVGARLAARKQKGQVTMPCPGILDNLMHPSVVGTDDGGFRVRPLRRACRKGHAQEDHGREKGARCTMEEPS